MAKSRGLGDDLKKVFDATGITKVVEVVTDVLGIEDCGCTRRQETANNWFPYKNNEGVEQPIIEQNINDFTPGLYIFNNNSVLTKDGVTNHYRIGDKILINSDNPSYNDFSYMYIAGVIRKE